MMSVAEMSAGRRRFVAGLGFAAAGLGLAKPALWPIPIPTSIGA